MADSDNGLLKPGEKVKESTQAIEVGPRGGNPSKTEVTLVEGKTVPPTSAPGRRFKPIDLTKHKGK